jgi:hypothetical protein
MRKSILIFSLVLLALSLIDAQNLNTPVRSSSTGLSVIPHPDYVSQLLSEINSMNAKSERLRKQAADNGPGSADLLAMANSLDEKSREKRTEAYQVNFQINSALYKENKKTISGLQKKNNAEEHKMHLAFLMKDSEKNVRRAEDLYEEGLMQKNPTLKLGTLDNAEEAILLAIRQQQEIIEIQRPANSVATTK